MNKILIASKNKGKIDEFKTLFSQHNIKVISLHDLDDTIEDIEETGETFEENAALKAEVIAKQFQLPVLADDSGLIVDALDGAPGIYSARYAGSKATDEKNNSLLLKNMVNFKEDERTARFICVLAVARPEKKTAFFTGFCEGNITKEERGINGFGYDPLFIPKGYERTMAQLPQQEKNAISHRSEALHLLEKEIEILFSV